MKELDWKFDIQRFADDGDDGDQDAGGNDDIGGDDDPDSGGNAGDSDDDGKQFSQDDLDAIISRRLKRERGKWKDEMEKEKKKAKMDEIERLKAEKKEAEDKANDTLSKANQRLLAAETKAMSSELGIVDPDAAFALMDRSEVEVDEDGNVQGVKEALEALIEAKPYLKKQKDDNGGSSGGANPGGDNNNPKTIQEQIEEARKSGDLTTVFRLKNRLRNQ